MSNPIAKRCPKGYHINNKTGQCERFEEGNTPKEKRPTEDKEQVRTKGCKEGYHKHPGISGCHPISQKHTDNITASQWHKEHGLSENQPSPKKESKGQTDDVKSISTAEKVHIADVMTDHLCSYYTSKARRELSSHMETADRVVEGLDSDVEEPYKTAFKGTNIKVGTMKLTTEMKQSSAKELSKTIKINPYGLGTLRNLSMGNAESFLMCYKDHKGEIRFANEYNGATDSDIDSTLSRRDPSTSKETEWGFHFKGSKLSNSISHEYGHVCMHVLAHLKYYCQYSNQEKKSYTEAMERVDELREIVSSKGKQKEWKFAHGLEDFNKTAKEWNGLQYHYQMTCVGVIEMCEYLYKEIYKTEVIPSECYSVYGYTGKSCYSFNLPQYEVEGLNASERIAEAFGDVSVRGEKANSMSKLIVSYVNFETERCIVGGKEHFEDVIKDYVAKNGVPERIVKMY